MKKGICSVLGVLLATAPAGCGNGGGADDDNPFTDARPTPDAIDAAPPDASPPDGMLDAAPVVDAPTNAQGPLVTVVSPSEPSEGDFSSSAIVTDARFTARCLVEANPNTSDPVDAQSVRISAIAVGQSVEAFAQPSTVANEYVADLNVTGFPNGELGIRCTASDTSPEVRTNSDEIGTFLDLGPRVDVFSPLDDSSFADQMDVSFKVSADPVAMGDTGAEPDFDAVEIDVSGTDVTADITGDPDTGVFQGTIVFDDSKFVPPLEGPNTLTIRAPNTRSAEPVTRIVSNVFIADEDGPSIAVSTPEPGELVSGIVTLQASVTDDAGVDSGSVTATIAGEHEFALVSTGGSTYEGIFDTRLLGNMVFPTIVVRAKDAVGNQSSTGFVVALDNVPPVVSLDPPLVTDALIDPELGLTCSKLFDPVGPDAASDGQTVTQLSEIRTRINDLGNDASSFSGVNIPRAGVDDATVQLWVLDDQTDALLVDTDGDTICDEINPKLQPASIPMTADEAAVIDLVSLSPTGEAIFPKDPEEPLTNPECEDLALPEQTAGEGTALCPTTPATRITETDLGQDPIIYTIPPVTDLQCMGNAFDSVATNISDGWACLAVRARDNLGNVGISAPLRLCFDADTDQSDGCLAPGDIWDESTMGSLDDQAECTGTYDPMTDTVDPATPCQLPLDFPDDSGFQLIRIDI